MRGDAEGAATYPAAAEGQVWLEKEVFRHCIEALRLYVLKIKICKSFGAGKNLSEADDLVLIISRSFAVSQWGLFPRTKETSVLCRTAFSIPSA